MSLRGKLLFIADGDSSELTPQILSSLVGLAIPDADLLEGIACINYKPGMFFHELVVDACVICDDDDRIIRLEVLWREFDGGLVETIFPSVL